MIYGGVSKTDALRGWSFAAYGEQFDELGEHPIAVASREGEGKLGEEEAVGCADVEAAAGNTEGEIAATSGQGVQGG